MTRTHSQKQHRRKKGAPRLESSSAPQLVPVYRRVPWLPAAVTLAVLVSAIFAAEPIRDAVTLEPVAEAHLDLSAGYIALAPFSSILDVLTLLGARQHIALLVSLVATYVAIRVWLARRPVDETEGETQRRVTVIREARAAAIFLLAIVATYTVGAVVPRPMAALALTPPEIYMSVDFHSHTSLSHDGRPGWDASDVRAWHRAGGFDAAYISDHRSVAAAEQGIADNPPQAGLGTMLLQAIEVGWRGEHVNLLGGGRVYKGITTADLRDVDEQTLQLASLLVSREPLVIETIPGKLAKMVPNKGPGTAGVRAIEIVDGSPRGLDQSRLQRPLIVHLADSLNLALVAGSDNHGWGRTVPAWTVIRLLGWRGMKSDSLEYAIEQRLRTGREATRVVERRVTSEMGGVNVLTLALTAPLVTWGMLTTLSPDERVVWIVWVWGLALVVRAARARRARRHPRAA